MLSDISTPRLDLPTMFYILLAMLILFLSEYCVEYKKVVITENNIVSVYSVFSILLLMVIMLCGVFDGSQFIYFQF